MPPQHGSTEVQRVRLLAEVEQLRIHRQAPRQPTSKTLRELISYCQSHEPSDALVHPTRENPFKERKSCAIL